MTAIPEAASPPCELCGQLPSILSLMNLGDWSNTRACGSCAPAFLRSVADAIEGVAPPEPEPAAADCPLCGQTVPPEDQQAHVDMHLAAEAEAARPARPDPLVTKVVRSTHGRRHTAPAPGSEGE